MTAHNEVRDAAPLRPAIWSRGVHLGDFVVAIGPLLLIAVLALASAYWFVRPAPATTLRMTSGPEGSTFRLTAEKYRKILARHGVTLQVLPSEGSLDNLKKLADPRFQVDIGFVQGGVSSGVAVDTLVSLGVMFQEPLAVFYRGVVVRNGIPGLRGRRLAIGPEGSGTHLLALTLLKANGIEPGPTHLPLVRDPDRS